MSKQRCDGDCFNCKFDDYILNYGKVPTDERSNPKLFRIFKLLNIQLLLLLILLKPN